jgi:hypothetical protein
MPLERSGKRTGKAPANAGVLAWREAGRFRGRNEPAHRRGKRRRYHGIVNLSGKADSEGISTARGFGRIRWPSKDEHVR